ncbi:probable serine hydrolase [Malaya genurostris]|uniref:probable serine hydrolase n=1 Tax=Malaya genurostris TaxID=325434 RepID=UPI0026F3CA1B|nr:probable serine hydrolase [Malaya genurostris]
MSKLTSLARQTCIRKHPIGQCNIITASANAHRCVHNQEKNESRYVVKREVEEVKIPVPYGEIAGKWWGPKDVRPILSLHGWQDNAGTFDTLIPLLPHHISFLAIDFPGHGLSSRIPNGMTYHTFDSVYLVKNIMNHYNWKKISLLGHSMGSIISMIFSSIFPEKVDLYVGIDALKPHINDPTKLAKRLSKRIPKILEADIRNQSKQEPPAYSYEELIDRLHLGTEKSVTKEAAPYLLERNIEKSSTNPEKYYFTRDSRLKYSGGIGWGQDINLELAKRMTMPYMFIKALRSPYYEDKKYFDEYVTLVQQINPTFELEFVDSTHHLHLTEPQKIAPMITKFLCKHWQKQSDSGRQ